MYNKFAEQIGHQITLQYVCRISFFTTQKFYSITTTRQHTQVTIIIFCELGR